jgi:uroporphyrinogen decarboxylase
VEPLIPDLLDISMDILNPLQFSALGMDPVKLKKRFGRDLCFYGGIDIQHTLPHGTPQEVRAEVRERIDVLGRDGGFILGSAHSLMDDVPVRNILAMYDEARRYRPR